jgi:Condensation domain
MSEAPRQTVPLSSQQRSLWEQYLRAPNTNYNICVSLRILGALNEERLRKSIEGVIQRHGTLRTRIAAIGGTPCQVIDSADRHHRLETLIRDVSRIDGRAVCAVVDRFLSRSFNPAGGGLFRSRLLRISPGDHILLFQVDHLVIDGYSVGLLLDDLWCTYRALSENRPPALPESEKNYSDYVQWQQTERARWRLKHGPYWRKHLANIKPLPFQRLRAFGGEIPRQPRARLSLLPVRFDEMLTAQVYATARLENTIPAMIVLSSFIALLSGWSNQADQVVQVVVAGRDDPEYAHVVGYFADQLVLRIEVTRLDRFKDLLVKVIAEFCTAYEHRGDGGPLLDSLTEIEQAGRVLFNWVSLPAHELAGPPGPVASGQIEDALRAEPFPFTSPNRFPEVDASSPFVMGFSGMYPGKAITAKFIYNPYVFSPRSAKDFLEDLIVLVTRFNAQPEDLVYSMLGEVEARRRAPRRDA